MAVEIVRKKDTEVKPKGKFSGGAKAAPLKNRDKSKRFVTKTKSTLERVLVINSAGKRVWTWREKTK